MITASKVRGRKFVSRAEYLTHPALYAKRGNDLPHARVTPEIVREIRANRNGWPRWRIADRYGLHVRTVEKIATRETWTHVA